MNKYTGLKGIQANILLYIYTFNTNIASNQCKYWLLSNKNWSFFITFTPKFNNYTGLKGTQAKYLLYMYTFNTNITSNQCEYWPFDYFYTTIQ